MKPLHLFVTLILTGLFSLSLNAQEWKTLNEKNYSIDYPETWELNTVGEMESEFIIFSPLGSLVDKFRERVNFIIQDVSANNLNLDQYVKGTEAEVKTKMINGKIIESERINNKEITYHKIIYSGQHGGFDLQFEQYLFVKDGNAYVLTFTCEKDKFKTYQKTGERILNSFLLK